MRTFLTCLCLVAACDTSIFTPPPEPTATSSSERGVPTLEAAKADGLDGGDGAHTTRRFPASRASRQNLGVERWRVVQVSNGDTQLAGEKANGRDAFWLWVYQSGNGGNPWTIFESDETYAAIRVDGNEVYLDPRAEDWAWERQDTFIAAFASDAELASGRVIQAHTGAAAIPAAGGSGTDGADGCGLAIARYAVATLGTAAAAGATTAACLSTPLTTVGGIALCGGGIATTLFGFHTMLGDLENILDECDANSAPPPPDPRPDDPFEDDPPGSGKEMPAQTIGDDAQGWSWFRWTDPDGTVHTCYRTGAGEYICF